MTDSTHVLPGLCYLISVSDQLATKQDLAELRAETKRDLAEAEQRITDKLTEAIRDSQTEVLRAFYNWARPLEMRLRPMEELSQRLSWLEDRVAELERGRFPSAH